MGLNYPLPHSTNFGLVHINPLPNDNFLDWSNLKAFADDKTKVTETQKFFLEWVNKKHRGKTGEMLVTSIFSFSNYVFNRLLLRVVKSLHCVVRS